MVGRGDRANHAVRQGVRTHPAESEAAPSPSPLQDRKTQVSTVPAPWTGETSQPKTASSPREGPSTSGERGRGNCVGSGSRCAGRHLLWSTPQGDEPTGRSQQSLLLLRCALCFGQNRHGPSGWTLQDTFPHAAVGPESLISAARAPQAQSCADSPGWHGGPGHCDLSCSTQRWSPALPWPVICIGQWPGHRARRGEAGKRTLWPPPSCRPRGQN